MGKELCLIGSAAGGGRLRRGLSPFQKLLKTTKKDEVLRYRKTSSLVR